MPKSELLVVIIETPNSCRSQPLLNSLASDQRFNVVRLPAHMYGSYSEVENKNIEVNSELFQILHRRRMSPQEIGCAISHNVARQLISNSGEVGIVLEDDARIIDMSNFFDSVTDVLSEIPDSFGVLSLTHAVRTNMSGQIPERIKAIRIYSNPPLAVAYAITPNAASQLVSKNTPVAYVSDWPDSNVKYFCLNKALVNHGDENTKSTIDLYYDMNRTNRNWIFSFQKWFLIHYFFHARKIVSFNLYCRNQFRRPFLRLFDIMRIHFLRKWKVFW